MHVKSHSNVGGEDEGTVGSSCLPEALTDRVSLRVVGSLGALESLPGCIIVCSLSHSSFPAARLVAVTVTVTVTEYLHDVSDAPCGLTGLAPMAWPFTESRQY